MDWELHTCHLGGREKGGLKEKVMESHVQKARILGASDAQSCLGSLEERPRAAAMDSCFSEPKQV